VLDLCSFGPLLFVRSFVHVGLLVSAYGLQ